jgi:hypothetical protein
MKKKIMVSKRMKIGSKMVCLSDKVINTQKKTHICALLMINVKLRWKNQKGKERRALLVYYLE